MRCTPSAPATLQGDAGQGGRGWRVHERRGGGEVEEGLSTAAFTGGEGAPMGSDVGCGVLQHRCGRGKRELGPVWEWRSLEGTHHGGGRQLRCSAKFGARERPPVARGSSPGVGTVGREVVLERGGAFERLGRLHGREGKRRGERGGGPGMGVPHDAGAVVGPSPDRRVAPRPCPSRS
jgi:hypothetical protein